MQQQDARLVFPMFNRRRSQKGNHVNRFDDRLDSVVAVDRVKRVFDSDQNRSATHIFQQPSPFLFVFEDRSRVEQFIGLRREGRTVASLEGDRLH